MRKFLTMLIAATLAAVAAARAAAPEIDLDYEKFTLSNGLRVIVHEDRKAPIVAVSIWYHVGSKDEPEGRTGFAHLFEHLMFNGSENFDQDYISALQELGATGLNGTTWFDRTNYFQNVPTSALERVLFLESDRMGHLLGAIDQAKLDEQRGVVQNEKRQGDNQPYGTTGYRILEGVFPVGHPYRHSTIGSMDDLNAASMEDVQDWFRSFYGASNAVLVLAGDIDAETARPLVEKYFGDIPAGPPVRRLKSWVPDRRTNVREEMLDQSAPLPRIYRVWATPDRTTRENILLQTAGEILAVGKNSRLHRELVINRKLASDVSFSNWAFELASMFRLQITLEPHADIDEVNAIVDEVLAEYLENGPTSAEVERVRNKLSASVVRGLEQIGGFGGKAVSLAQGELYAGRPDFVRQQLEWLDGASAADIAAASRHWLADGAYQLDVTPFGDRPAAAEGVDRSRLPDVGATPDFDFPTIETGRLRNGVEIVFARRAAVPVVNIAVQFDAGYAADAGGKLGAASFTLAMLEEGTRRRSSLEIAAELDRLGATLSSGSNLDMSTVRMSALRDNLSASVALLADVIQNPAFPQPQIDLMKSRFLAQIRQEKAQPVQAALRLLPPALYGEGHAYGAPLTGTGTEESIASMSRDDLAAFHRAWLRPDNARIFVVGDASLDEIVSILDRAFRSWRAPEAPLPVKNISPVSIPDRARILILDRPGSPQSLILAGQVAPPSGDDRYILFESMDGVIGGNFFSRINMNLREDKSWSYGAFTFSIDARGQRPYFIYAPVQTDRTGDSMREISREFEDFISTRPPTEEELALVVNAATLTLPGQYETAGAVLNSLLSSARFGRAYDYPTTLKAQYEAVSPDDVAALARDLLRIDGFTWLVVGDRSQIEDQIRDLDIGDIIFIDDDGAVVD